MRSEKKRAKRLRELDFTKECTETGASGAAPDLCVGDFKSETKSIRWCIRAMQD